MVLAPAMLRAKESGLDALTHSCIAYPCVAVAGHRHDAAAHAQQCGDRTDNHTAAGDHWRGRTGADAPGEKTAARLDVADGSPAS
ncbi:hypothetical protein MJ575_15365 [Klebsiella pneumoniae]|nr:hypothetical protein MJ575_15365 [Klebsiella pneumoniae]